MKHIIMVSLIAGSALLSGCGSQESNKEGIDRSNLDTTVAPGVDFYQYACGGWIKNNPIPADKGRFGTFDQLAENNRTQIKALIEELSHTKAAEGSIAQKIGDLYAMGLDSVRLNNQGYQPIVQSMQQIDNIQTKEAIIDYVARSHGEGSDAFFSFFVDADAKSSTMNIGNLYQSGICLEDRDYYLVDNSKNQAIIKAYRSYINTICGLTGHTAEQGKKIEASVLKIETALAKASWSREELRDPIKAYNKVKIADLQKQCANIDWSRYFKSLSIAQPEQIVVMQPSYIKAVDQLIGATSIEELRNYLKFQLITSAAFALSDDLQMANFNFYEGVLSGIEEPAPRWKRSLDVTNSVLSEAVGQMYVARYFPASAKQEMLEIIDNLKIALSERINSLTWMSSQTKMKALEKLSTFYVKVGYPDKWRDYSALTIDNKLSYYENLTRASRFETAYQLSFLGKEVDKTKWYMSPQTVNAYYNPSSNEICFPAGILQPPFFYPNGDASLNYGAIGVVIGHEMTHGFDDQGRQYDPVGNLQDWWTEADAKLFTEKTHGLVAQFDSIKVLGDTRANGTFTLGENIADQGGLLIAYQAYMNHLKGVEEPKEINGFTPQQSFFLSYATVWAGNIREQEILRLTQLDPHSLGKWRVNASIRNIEAFYEAFAIKQGDPMYLAPEKRVVIW